MKGARRSRAFEFGLKEIHNLMSGGGPPQGVRVRQREAPGINTISTGKEGRRARRATRPLWVTGLGGPAQTWPARSD